MTLLDRPEDPHKETEPYPRFTIVERGLMSLRFSDREGLWVASSAAQTEHFQPAGRHGRDRLLVTDELDSPLHEFLTALFSDVVSGPRPSFLSIDEIGRALVARQFPDLALGVLVSGAREAVVIVRGDLERTIVPWSWFRSSGTGTAPDFNDVAVTDAGLAIRLGKYEASMDAILYGFDRDYRARARQRQLETDVSFGAALRRLRLQKGVTREEFPGISQKEIARLERGEVVRPREATLRAIADKLGVEPGDIETY